MAKKEKTKEMFISEYLNYHFDVHAVDKDGKWLVLTNPTTGITLTTADGEPKYAYKNFAFSVVDERFSRGYRSKFEVDLTDKSAQNMEILKRLNNLAESGDIRVYTVEEMERRTNPAAWQEKQKVAELEAANDALASEKERLAAQTEKQSDVIKELNEKLKKYGGR